MARRLHVSRLTVGDNPLDPAQAHHARDVLRLPDGTAVEVFDDAGAEAAGVLVVDAAGVRVRVAALSARAPEPAARLIIASAVPKGDRADWMVEKLSELGVAEWVPLAAARSVVLPEGKGKHERWVRIATEAAKQSRRAGVMKIGTLTPLSRAVADLPAGARAWCLSTEEDGTSAGAALRAGATPATPAPLVAFVGPEGGWTPPELDMFRDAGAAFVRLTGSILRVETAAVAVAAIVGACGAGGDDGADRA